MKKMYFLLNLFFIVFALTATINSQNKNYTNSSDVMENRILRTHLRNISTNPTKNPENQNHYKQQFIPDTKGKIATGFVLYDGSHNNYKGLGSFDIENPSALNCYKGHQFFASGGAYYDGLIYATMYRIQNNQLIKMGFFKITPETGVSYLVSSYTDYPYLFSDATYDYVTDKMFFITDLKSTETSLGTVNLDDGSMSIIKPLGKIFLTLATDRDGQLLGISKDGNLYKINKTDGTLTTVGTTGIMPDYVQSMICDYDSNTMYWCANDTDQNGFLAKVDLTTAVATNIGEIGNNAQISCFHIPFFAPQTGIPSNVTNLKITPGNNGALNAIISFKTPTKTVENNNLESLTKIEILRDNAIVHTFKNPSVGTTLTYTDNVSENKNYKYRIVAFNSVGRGVKTDSTLFIGEDTPLPVLNAQLTTDGSKGILNWTPQNLGINGGYVNINNLSYTITRLPEEIILTENSTGTAFTDETITEQNRYSYTIIAKNNTGSSKTATSNITHIGNAYTIPFECKFENKTVFNKWEIIDVNNDNRTWSHGFSDNRARYNASGDNNADDWLISPTIKLIAGQKYRIRFDLRKEGATYPEKVKVYCGNGYTVADMTKELADYQEIPTTDKVSQTIIFTPETTADYNFGFHCYSPKNQFFVTVTNVIVETTLNNDLVALTLKGHNMPMINKAYNYIVKILNRGINAQNSYKIELIDNENNILAEKIISDEISPDETADISIRFIPKNLGNTEIRARVVLNNDEDITNNISTKLAVEVLPEADDEYAVIADGTTEMREMPFYFYYKSSVSQNIYTSEEIGIGSGMIKTITYYYNNKSNKEFTKPVKVYMLSTNKNNLTDGWIPRESMKLVFDGEISFIKGIAELTITLNEPYLYDGRNLCIFTERPKDTEYFNNVYFLTDERNTDMSRIYNSDSSPFDGTQAGTIKKCVPNINMKVTTKGEGKISGTVKNSNDEIIAGANIKIEEIEMQTTSSENGTYSFGYVPTGIYTMQVTKHGYINYKEQEIVVEVGSDLEINITMTSKPLYTVTGTIQYADGSSIEDATIKISGYQNYETTTDAQGIFSIDNVIQADGYSLIINKRGTIGYTSTFDLTDSDKNLGTIKLADINNAPSNVKVLISEKDDKAEITFDAAPDTQTFRYDDGTADAQLGFQTGTEKSILGSVHRVSAQLTKMSWQTSGSSNAGGPHKTVNIFVLDLDESGNPTSTVLYSKKSIENKDDQWNTFTFEEPVNAPRGFMIALSYKGYLGLCCDSGSSQQWPFKENCNYFSGDYTTGQFIVAGPGGQQDVTSNFLIRAEGYATAKSEQQSGILTVCSTSKPEEQSRSLTGYKIYRLNQKDIKDQSKWTLLTSEPINTTNYTDLTWSDITGGTYLYAVKAIYSADVTSDVSLSNTVKKPDYYKVTIESTSNGAIVVKNGDITINNADKVISKTKLTITANPDNGYLLKEIKINGEAITGNTITVTNDITISATFESIQPDSFLVTIEPTQNGSIEVKNGDIIINNKETVTSGTELIISTIPDKDYKLKEIKVNNEVITGNIITVTTNITIKAIFEDLDGIENHGNINVSIYPNPVKNILNIKGDYTEAKIYNISGKLLITASKTSEIDLSGIPDGNYIITILLNDKIITKKIIKRN